VQALFKAVGKGQKALEKELLTYLSDPVSALVEMVTVRLLSIHADGEQTLDERNYVLTVRQQWRMSFCTALVTA
jgi:hypothetical protein